MMIGGGFPAQFLSESRALSFERGWKNTVGAAKCRAFIVEGRTLWTPAFYEH